MVDSWNCEDAVKYTARFTLRPTVRKDEQLVPRLKSSPYIP